MEGSSSQGGGGGGSSSSSHSNHNNNNSNNNNHSHDQDINKIALQFFIKKKIIKDSEVRKTVKKIAQDYKVAEPSPDDLVADINKRISFMMLEIRKASSEVSGEPYWCLINNHSDEASQMSGAYKLPEIELFKKIVEEIITQDPSKKDNTFGTLGSKDALNLIEKYNKESAQDAIARFVKDRWLEEDDKGILSLGVRSYIELQTYLKEMYGDYLADCVTCKDLVTKGEQCANCEAKMHTRCKIKLYGNKENKRCPDCGRYWTIPDK